MSWFRTICVALTVSLMATGAARADVKLPAIIGDNVMLQQGHDLPFWGWAEAGEQVSVTVAGKTTMAVAGADGRWSLRCPAV
ncbi:MAG TPA: sialate O-acetylesterase, partial [Schlesneria sp.]